MTIDEEIEQEISILLSMLRAGPFRDDGFNRNILRASMKRLVISSLNCAEKVKNKEAITK